MFKSFYQNIILVLCCMIFSQTAHPFPPLYLITIPTSGTLPEGTYSIEGLLIDDGGIVSRITIGLSNNLTLGMSWGIQNLVGDIEPSFNKKFPDYHFKYRLWNEDIAMPAIVFGFDSQGRGKYRNILNLDGKSFDRYEQKSLGYYISFSKNYNMMGNLGLHVGLNKTLEIEDGDNDINLFFGIDKEINRTFSLMIEYDAMLNDNSNAYDYEDISIGKGIGYLNAGIRWSIAENLLLELNFNDINRNQKISETAHREFKVLYSKSF